MRRKVKAGGPSEAAVITGASSGIGLELARLFAHDGHPVVLVARRGNVLARVARDLRAAHGVTAVPVELDVSAGDAPEVLLRKLRARRLQPAFLVNNAGFGLYGRFTDTDWGREQDMIDLNVVALTRLTKAFLAVMVARGRGRVLNVASTAAFQPGPLMSVYYATKAYVLSFSQAVACEVAERGVSVTALCPGPTHTGFQEAAALAGSRAFEGKAVGQVMEAAEVARLGYEGMMRGESVVIAGMRNALLATAAQVLPRDLVTRVSRWAIESE